MKILKLYFLVVFLISTWCWIYYIFSVGVNGCMCVCVPVCEDGEVLLWLEVDPTPYHCNHCVEHLYICNIKNRFIKSRKHQWDCRFWLPAIALEGRGGWGKVKWTVLNVKFIDTSCLSDITSSWENLFVWVFTMNK